MVTRDSDSASATFRVWPGKGDVWFRTRSPLNGVMVASDGRHVILCNRSSGGAAVYKLGRSVPVLDGMSAGLIRGNPVAIRWDEKTQPTYLQFQGKRIRPPAQRQFLMIAPQGDWIATDRVADPRAQDESKYSELVELWRLDAGDKLVFSRSLGRHWWDGGSTGVPSYLAVAGTGLVLIDNPSGGGALSFPVWIRPGEGPARPFGKLKMPWTQIAGLPLSFAKGMICPVWILDLEAEQLWQSPFNNHSLMELGTPWLAWMDGESVLLKPIPVGFVNAWVESPTEMGYATKISGGVEIRRMQMPPSGWWRPGK